MTLSVSNVSTNEKTTLVRKIHNPKAQAPAVYIPAWLIQIPNSKLPYSCKLVYGRLAQWASCEGIAFRSVPQLAIELGMPKRTVDSSIQKLKAVGLIGTYQTRNGGSNHYEFYDHDWMYQPIDRNLCYQSDHISPHADIALPHAKMAVHINNNKYNNNIISDLDEKSGFMSNCNDEYLGALETAEFTGNNLKSDYQKNQCTKETLLLENEHILRKREDSSSIRINAIKNDEIVEAYHEVLPDCPKIKVIDTKLNNQLNHMKKNWPRYQKEGKEFSIDSFKDYLNYLKQHYSWFTNPYTTQNGNKKQNNLRVFTREINITKIVNGEFSVN